MRIPQPDEQCDVWLSRGTCRAEGRELFHGEPGEPVMARIGREEAAKRICARCPVLVECREHVLRADQLDGVWGGLTPVERRMILDRAERRRLRLESQPPTGKPLSPAVAILG